MDRSDGWVDNCLACGDGWIITQLDWTEWMEGLDGGMDFWMSEIEGLGGFDGKVDF